MFLDRDLATSEQLAVPEVLLPTKDSFLPELTPETLELLSQAGWARVGIMVAFVDSDGAVMMLEHNDRDKNVAGALGPLGETSQQSGPVIEQPFETLFRGIQEELGVEQPANLRLWMYERGGWVVNQWPRGNNYPGEFSCAISLPIFISDEEKGRLLSVPHGSEEIGSLRFLKTEEILEMDDAELRPGVKGWLRQLNDNGLLEPQHFGYLQVVDFSGIYASSLRDIELQP